MGGVNHGARRMGRDRWGGKWRDIKPSSRSREERITTKETQSIGFVEQHLRLEIDNLAPLLAASIQLRLELLEALFDVFQLLFASTQILIEMLIQQVVEPLLCLAFRFVIFRVVDCGGCFRKSRHAVRSAMEGDHTSSRSLHAWSADFIPQPHDIQRLAFDNRGVDGGAFNEDIRDFSLLGVTGW